MKKILLKDWNKFHPYERANEVDIYYWNLSNKINKVLHTHSILLDKQLVNDGLYEETAIFIAAWFEDVISQTGIWQVFTSQCLKRYGSRLPFYKIGEEDYYADEINKEDIRFILWHCFQRRKIGDSIFNPLLKKTEPLVDEIYDILDKEYETAPENERLIDFYDFSNITEANFIEYRKKVEDFYYGCYINLGTLEKLERDMQDKVDECGYNDRVDVDTLEIYLYSLRVNEALGGRTPLLSITAPEFLRLIIESHGYKGKAPFMDIDYKSESFYMVVGETKDYYVFKELANDEDEYKVRKESMQHGTLKLIPFDTVLTSSLFKYGKLWNHNGSMMRYSIKENPEMKSKIKQLRETLSSINAKRDYLNFKLSTGRKEIIFLKGTEEFVSFITKTMDYDISKLERSSGFNMSDLDNSVIMLTAKENKGMCILHNHCDCISSPDNPYYNKENAEKYALNFLIDPIVAPYEICCMLSDRGYLDDACLLESHVSEQDKMSDKLFVKNNAQFLLDYFFKCCREKDYKA